MSRSDTSKSENVRLVCWQHYSLSGSLQWLGSISKTIIFYFFYSAIILLLRYLAASLALEVLFFVAVKLFYLEAASFYEIKVKKFKIGRANVSIYSDSFYFD